MLLQNIRQIYIATHKVDFRKGHSGLLAECYALGLKPFDGDVVLFIGRCKSKIKLIHADGNGLWVSYKKFDNEAMKTSFRFLTEPDCQEISMAELAMILEGNRFKVEKRVQSRCQA